MAAGFCAVCVADIPDVKIREPLGRDDALVAVCEACASSAVPNPPAGVGRSRVNNRDTTGRASRIRDARAKQVADGFCAWGRHHDRPVTPPYCEDCRARRTASKRTRTPMPARNGG